MTILEHVTKRIYENSDIGGLPIGASKMPKVSQNVPQQLDDSNKGSGDIPSTQKCKCGVDGLGKCKKCD